MSLFEILAQWQNGAIMVGVASLISVVRSIFPALFDKAIVMRVLPAIPIVLCEALVWLPGVAQDGWGSTAILGLVLGTFSMAAYKMYKQTFLGKDDVIIASKLPEGVIPDAEAPKE